MIVIKNVLDEVKIIVNEVIKEYLPDITPSDLEGDGTVFYMNDRNGTWFDYHMNKHLPSFMVFYNDKENLGAIKLMILNNGEEVRTKMHATEEDLLRLAVILEKEADNKELFGASIDKINTNIEVSDQDIKDFAKEGE